MQIETYSIAETRDEAARLLEKRYPLDAQRTPIFHRFRGDDLGPMLGFGMSYFFDATQWLWAHLMIGPDVIGDKGIVLPSGWTVKRLDPGRIWEKHLEFMPPNDHDRGYILKGTLSMIERKLPGAKPKTVADLFASLKGLSEKQRLFKENAVSAAYTPEDSSRFTNFTLYQFGKEWGERDDLVNALASGSGLSFWQYMPQAKASRDPTRTQTREDGERLLASETTAASSVDASSEALYVMADLLTEHDPAGYQAAMDEHRDTSYFSLTKDGAEMFGIMRPTLSEPSFATSELPSLLAQLWKRTAALGIMDQVDILKEAAKLLIEHAHSLPTNAHAQYSHNLFARASEDGFAIFMVEHEMTTSYVIEKDRIIVADLDQRTMAVERVIMDFALNGDAVTLIRPTDYRLGDDLQRLRYGLNSIISFHDMALEASRG
ncbi:hypothetical protein [Rhizobium sp. MHM7A]|uniref:hypothetical protein n=1 Tax=Rhizobium sp. MHM7A TaxID=2583233 RepID=UPI001105AF7A|nr:hypothetical protein [Rhizobium sp. MHM7A]TLX16699.1 hypothetical protein FFR93_04980 [Rhizobium sp. MHM7A]